MSTNSKPGVRGHYTEKQAAEVGAVIDSALREFRARRRTRRNRFEVTADRLGDDLAAASETLHVSGADRDAIARVRYLLQCWGEGEEP